MLDTLWRMAERILPQKPGCVAPALAGRRVIVTLDDGPDPALVGMRMGATIEEVDPAYRPGAAVGDPRSVTGRATLRLNDDVLGTTTAVVLPRHVGYGFSALRGTPIAVHVARAGRSRRRDRPRRRDRHRHATAGLSGHRRAPPGGCCDCRVPELRDGLPWARPNGGHRLPDGRWQRAQREFAPAEPVLRELGRRHGLVRLMLNAEYLNDGRWLYALVAVRTTGSRMVPEGLSPIFADRSTPGTALALLVAVSGIVTVTTAQQQSRITGLSGAGLLAD